MKPRSYASIVALVLATSATGCASTTEQRPVEAAPPPSPTASTLTPREATVRIEVRPSDTLKASLRNVLPPDLAAYAADQGSFGSGFFVRHHGKVRAITNHHVVGSASKATIVLDGDVRIEGEVLFADERRDIAVISVKDTRIDLPILELDVTPVRADDEVRASGYPGVGFEQSYRLTRGTVSDASWEIPQLDRGVAFIQHTAAIDPGSSGGPLFRRDSLRVVGINTMKVTTNDNLYAAVPAQDVAAALAEAEKHERPSTTREASQRVARSCDALVQELGVDGRPTDGALRLMSEGFVAEFGASSFYEQFYGYSPYAGNPVATTAGFIDSDLLVQLRPMAFWRLRDLLQRRLPAELRCGQIVDADLEHVMHDPEGVVRVRVPLSDGSATFGFVFEQGGARLRDFVLPPEPAPPVPVFIPAPAPAPQAPAPLPPDESRSIGESLPEPEQSAHIATPTP